MDVPAFPIGTIATHGRVTSQSVWMWVARRRVEVLHRELPDARGHVRSIACLSAGDAATYLRERRARLESTHAD